MRRCFAAAFAAFALAAIAASSSHAENKPAIVLLHGGGSSGSQFNDMRPTVEKAGYRLVTPDMCWAQSRRYDKSAIDCMADVEKAITRLRADGFQKIILGGHSQGGINAILYAAYHKDLAGLVVFAPSGPPTGTDRTNLSVAYAHRLIAEGKGDVPVNFGTGINEILATPESYLSYTGMESPLYDLELLPKITTPILWVAGTKDPGQANAASRFGAAAGNSLNRFVTVTADHFETPDAGVSEMIAWLDRLTETFAKK